ncbi:MAG TPA: hypothetical protein VFV99_18355 [Kofleriaceae bacterium]|nr:hypothetical protein [Kofleriaceae bacterium]
MNTKNEELTTIDSADLDTVTGGMWGPIIAQGLSWLGSMFGGGTNVGVQNGNNNRQAQGNTGPTTLGDGSPIKGPQQ